MLFRFILVIALLIGFGELDAPGSSKDDWGGLSLVSGFPTNIVHEDFPYTGEPIFAVLTSFDLTNTDVVRGEDVPDRLSFRVQALNVATISEDKRVFLLLNVDGNKREVIYWAHITPHVCFPKETVLEHGIERVFYVEVERNNQLCTNAFRYR